MAPLDGDTPAIAGNGIAPWFVAGASVTGAAHVREGAGCDDAWATRVREGGGLVTCVCDGAGSAALGHVGARLAADAIADRLVATPEWPPSLDAIVAAHEHARGLLEEAAAAHGVDIGELACTSVTAAAAGDRLVVGHVGDGAVVVRAAGDVRLVSAPERGDAPGETWFLTNRGWREHLRVVTVDGVDAFTAFTDGCERAALELDPPVRAHQPFARSLVEYALEVADPARLADELLGLLSSDAMAGSSDDDKTLVIAGRAPTKG